MTKEEKYVVDVFDAAYAVERQFGLPRLAVIAQSALENGWGKSAPGNMYFGIKTGSNWTGKKQLLTTTEYINGRYITIKDWFRAYDSAVDSFLDYGRFITSVSRYRKALEFTHDPERYILEIRNAGYATDPNYVVKIKTIMNKVAAMDVYKQRDKNKDDMKVIDISIVAAFVVLGVLIGYKLFKR
jgi:flagellar protein FlgJ